jgi:hypothetical protein
MADPVGSAWLRITRALAQELPGEWTTGGTGGRAVLVSRPDEWMLWWIGLDRIRRDEPTYLVAGAVDLVTPFLLTYQHGLRSDESRRQPRRVDLRSEDAPEWIRAFVVEDALPILGSWSRERVKQLADEDFAKPPDRRLWPAVFPGLAGWRVVEDTGTPEGTARQAVELFKSKGSAKPAAWYQALLSAWESGGRPAALEYLEDQRAAALASLKLAKR